MPKSKETPPPTSDSPDSPLLEKAARAVGTALGVLATKTGMAAVTPAKATPPPKKSRLPKKDKSRLPRKEKKAQAKLAPKKASR